MQCGPAHAMRLMPCSAGLLVAQAAGGKRVASAPPHRDPPPRSGTPLTPHRACTLRQQRDERRGHFGPGGHRREAPRYAKKSCSSTRTCRAASTVLLVESRLRDRPSASSYRHNTMLWSSGATRKALAHNDTARDVLHRHSGSGGLITDFATVLPTSLRSWSWMRHGGSMRAQRYISMPCAGS